jgi:outer membrane protein assembly factor BamE
VKPRFLRPRAPLRLAFVALAAALAAGCATVDEYVPTWRNFLVYKLDINQGNYLSQDMVDKLRVGQTKQQVRTLLGTPLVTSAFRDNRWDYVYEFQRQGRTVEHRGFTVYFVDEKLARWEGDEMPQSVAELNRAAAERALGRSPSPEDKGFFERMLDVFRTK